MHLFRTYLAPRRTYVALIAHLFRTYVAPRRIYYALMVMVDGADREARAPLRTYVAYKTVLPRTEHNRFGGKKKDDRQTIFSYFWSKILCSTKLVSFFSLVQ